MAVTDLVLIALVLTAMTAVAAVDARRAIIDPRLVLALVGAGLLWRLFGAAETGSLWNAALGAALGVAIVAIPITLAQLRRRRWPLFPGDAMLLGGLGFVLGPLWLGWALLAGSLCSLLHRACLQRRRGRSFLKGYCPLGPGMAAGAMAVFLFVNVGGVLAADGYGVAAPLPPAKPGAHREIRSIGIVSPGELGEVAADRIELLAATELGPLHVPLPSSLAAVEVVVEEKRPLPFAAIANRIATLASVPVEVEERPSRVAGGEVRLPEPPDMLLAFEERLPTLLNLVAARSGYDWTWADGAIVFYRYRDSGSPWYIDRRAPEAATEEPAAPPLRSADGKAAAVNRSASSDQGVPLWVVDPARHETLLDVLEEWGARAGWSVVWNIGRRYAVRAGASFEGGFLDAVDRLLAAPATRRSLVALAHEPNRHLVIELAGALR